MHLTPFIVLFRGGEQSWRQQKRMQKELTTKERTKLSENEACHSMNKTIEMESVWLCVFVRRAFTLEAERFSLQTWRTILHFHIQCPVSPRYFLFFFFFLRIYDLIECSKAALEETDRFN